MRSRPFERPTPTLRIGVLGAARITKQAMLDPARDLVGVTVTAVAARDSERAAKYALRHGIPIVHTRYQDLLDDPAIDAVYIPLPAALHAQWTLAAIRAGKHVLCEKPFTSNARDAERVAAAASSSSVVTMEAYHSAHHPNAEHLRDIVASGALGAIQHASARFCVPIPPGRDIRWNLELGGGGMLDVGYYPLRLLRDLFGPSPDIVGVDVKDRSGIDRLLTARLQFPGGPAATVVSGLWSAKVFRADLDVRGSRGRLRMFMPFLPHHGRLRVETPDRTWREHPGRRSTYSYQLQAFRDAVRTGAPVITGPAEAIAQLHIVDDIYRAAGLEPRPGMDQTSEKSDR